MYNYKFKVKYIIYIIILFSIITILLTGCTNNKKETYTLKENSPLQEEEKVTSSYTFKNKYGNYIMFGDDNNYYERSESEDKFKKTGTYQRYDNMFIVDSYGTKIYQLTKDEKNLIFYGKDSYVAIYERV
jgi:hypothetical protein